MSQFSLISNTFENPYFHRPVTRHNPVINKSQGVAGCLSFYGPPDRQSSKSPVRNASTLSSTYNQAQRTPNRNEKPSPITREKSAGKFSFNELCTICANNELSTQKKETLRKNREECAIQSQIAARNNKEEIQRELLGLSAEKKQKAEEINKDLEAKRERQQAEKQKKKQEIQERKQYEILVEKNIRQRRECEEMAMKARAKYRDELVSQITQEKTRKSVSREREIKEEKKICGLQLGDGNRERKAKQLKESCLQFNRQTTDRKKSKEKVQDATPTKVQSQSSARYEEAFLQAKAQKEKLRNYYKDEIERKNQERATGREYKRIEKVGMEDKWKEIGRELEAERKKARENQAEIRKILADQMKAKENTKKKEKVNDKEYRKAVESSNQSISPQKESPYGRCKQCNSPIK